MAHKKVSLIFFLEKNLMISEKNIKKINLVLINIYKTGLKVKFDNLKKNYFLLLKTKLV